jgi:hypothetical protein
MHRSRGDKCEIKLIYQMGTMYPLRPPHRSTHHILLPPDKTDKSSPRNRDFDLCGDGGWVDYKVVARACD